MLIKRLSKIGLTLLLAVSFIMPVSFNARAEFSSTDSRNIDLIEENTGNTYTRLGTTNNWLSQIKTELVSLNTEVTNIKTAVANTITTTLNQMNTKLGNISGYVDQIEGYINEIEGQLDDIYSALSTINSNLILLGNNTSANGTVLTNLYNLVNTYIGNMDTNIDGIGANVVIIKDNLTVNRNNTSGGAVSVAYSGGTATYNLTSFTVRTLTYANNEISFTTSTRYGNWLGIYITKMNQMYDIATLGFNKLYGWMYLVEYDLEYIGEELHNVYTNITAFKNANHTDITDFASQNHTDITVFKSAFDSFVNYWVDLAKGLYIMYDNIVYARRRPEGQSNVVDLGTHFGNNVSYNLSSYYFRSYSISNDQLVTTETLYYSNFRDVLTQRILEVEGLLRTYFYHMINNGLAGSIRNSVQSLDQNLTSLNNAETAASTDAISRINSFVPNISDISSLVALSWCSTFLQNLYLALGTFNIPILCGLVLAVCMQFIGYFKYKT